MCAESEIGQHLLLAAPEVSMNITPSRSCNIGGSEISKRRWFGIAMLVVIMALEIWIVLADSSPWWRLSFLPLLYLAISGILQAHEATCVRHAVRGTRNMGSGDEPITDDSESAILRRRGRSIIVKSALGATIVTAALLAI